MTAMRAGIDLQIKAARIPAADGLAQCRKSQGLRIGAATRRHRALRRGLHGGRCIEIRLADIEKNHGRVSLRDIQRQLLRGLGHFHDQKRLYAFSSLGDSHAVNRRLASSLCGTRLQGHAVYHAVNKLVAVGPAEGLCQLNALVDDDAHGDI